MSVEYPQTSHLQERQDIASVARREDILTADQAELLQRAERGEVPCPNCGQPLYAQMVVSTVPDLYAGVLLFCTDSACGFVEY
jgi:hypothetical protein